MLLTTRNAEEKRSILKSMLADGQLHAFPGAFNPLCARLIERKGFKGIYISGAVLSADLCLPDIGLATSSEFAARGQQIARVTDLPAIIDVDTGFGAPVNAARTVMLMEEAGISGCHLEDQIQQKRCGHLDGKKLVSTPEMTERIYAAVSSRRDQNFCIIARTDARTTEGLDASIDRMKAYIDAGADVIFPEALQTKKEFEQVRKAINVPILANMTEFGKSPLLKRHELKNLGFNIVIYPVTTLRLAMGVVSRGLETIANTGDQTSLLDEMQHRRDLYDLLEYQHYNKFDEDIFNFRVP